jgi:transcriptional regulator with XRE-family HTH domain
LVCTTICYTYVTQYSTTQKEYFLHACYLWDMAIHIGKKIKEELYKQELSVSAFAKKINRSRNVVYDIFGRESIDTALLNKIGLILHIDFFSLYSEQKEYKKEGVSAFVKEDKTSNQTTVDRLKNLEQQNEILTNEISYLKKIITLMEDKKKKK